jgi:hypothetical protein
MGIQNYMTITKKKKSWKKKLGLLTKPKLGIVNYCSGE